MTIDNNIRLVQERHIGAPGIPGVFVPQSVSRVVGLYFARDFHAINPRWYPDGVPVPFGGDLTAEAADLFFPGWLASYGEYCMDWDTWLLAHGYQPTEDE